VLARRRGLIGTGTEQSVTDGLGKGVLQKSKIYEKKVVKTYFS